MKRLIPLFIVAIVLAFASTMMVNDDANARDRARGYPYRSTYNFTLGIDTTAAYNQDTTTGVFNFNEVVNYGSLNGYIAFEYTAIDTGTAAADIPDTTKDTIICILKTAAEGGTPSKEIWRDTLAAFHVTDSVANTDYVAFNVSDSALWDKVYFDFVAIVADSDYSVARQGAQLHYRATVAMFAK